MTKKIWQKNKVSLNPMIESYTVGYDYLLDLEIFPYDIKGSLAHAKMLMNLDILTKKELEQISTSLEELENQLRNNEVKLAPSDEDCHTFIENYLIAKLGDTGKKIHTGRSRNDQVLTAVRLYMLEQGKILANKTLQTAEFFLKYADKYTDIPIPGYTHTQQAMLSSVEHLYHSYAESLIDDAEFMIKSLNHISKNPLGSAAGYGVSIPLDRKFTTDILGFKEIQINSIYAQSSRGKFESIYLEALTQIITTLSRFASDMILFTSREFEFFSAKDELVTGSSIMPQKRNLDGLEIMRGYQKILSANHYMIKNIITGLTSGYHRDLQLIKKPVIESSKILKDSLNVADLYIQGLKPNKDVINEKIKPDIYAADVANDLVLKQNMPFRDAYIKAYELMDSGKIDPIENIKTKISLGGPGNTGGSLIKIKLSDTTKALSKLKLVKV